MRIGTGYDIHKLVEGRQLVLGGVKIDFEYGLLGHSDADVLVHSIIDALLGAAALGDIGEKFPDDDEKFKDANSIKLLEITGKIISETELSIVNIDSTIIAQRPKMSPFIMQMRKNIADTLNIAIEQISIKAKTNEGLDAIGRGEAIAAMAIVLLK